MKDKPSKPNTFWQSSRLTMLVLLGYAAWVVGGSLSGWASYVDYDATLDARAVFVSTQANSIVLHGKLQPHGASTVATQRTFQGKSSFEIEIGGATPMRVDALFEFFDASYGDRLMLVPSNNDKVAVEALYRRRVPTSFRVMPGKSTVVVEPTSAGLRYRVVALSLVAAEAGSSFAKGLSPMFTAMKETPFGMGSGWMMTEDELAMVDAAPVGLACRRAYVSVKPAKPGRYKVSIPFRRVRPEHTPPKFTINGKPVDAKIVEDVERELEVAVFEVHLAEQSILGIEFEGRLLNRGRRRQGGDKAFVPYVIELHQTELAVVE